MGIIIIDNCTVKYSVCPIWHTGIDLNLRLKAIIEKGQLPPPIPKAINGGEVHSPSSEISLTFCKYVLVIFLTI